MKSVSANGCRDLLEYRSSLDIQEGRFGAALNRRSGTRSWWSSRAMWAAESSPHGCTINCAKDDREGFGSIEPRSSSRRARSAESFKNESTKRRRAEREPEP